METSCPTNCKHCGRAFESARAVALGARFGYCQPLCADKAIKAEGAAFAAWWDRASK